MWLILLNKEKVSILMGLGLFWKQLMIARLRDVIKRSRLLDAKEMTPMMPEE